MFLSNDVKAIIDLKKDHGSARIYLLGQRKSERYTLLTGQFGENAQDLIRNRWQFNSNNEQKAKISKQPYFSRI
ncbi:MAG: hypothetical protein EZS28_006573 [Streblomastix strix]|uniref:Uncharacterized protein n=1 Tax=Streblomastix strix TaxID=222440 RepID=A0A5J4WTL5_9EUKA|nr:MAG: hypothetical protein EZS28_006573 [Streblomastix strix]